MIPERVTQWLEENEYGLVESTRLVSGGCINNGMQFNTSSGVSFFLKTNTKAPTDMFSREVEGLAALDVDGGPRVPKPYLHAPDFLLMEDLAPSRRVSTYWEDFGQQMAVLHDHNHEAFGFHHDNYIGSTPQPNSWTENGYDFFAQHRLIFQADLATHRGLLTPQEANQVRALAGKLGELVPDQPASLLHGDLWSGNAMTDNQGAPVIIDPAAYYGWAEADLAMTALFGGFDDRFYDAYVETRSLPAGWRQRFVLYNLYHLLNHLNLFGRGYYGQVMDVIRKYT